MHTRQHEVNIRRSVAGTCSCRYGGRRDAQRPKQTDAADHKLDEERPEEHELKLESPLVGRLSYSAPQRYAEANANAKVITIAVDFEQPYRTVLRSGLSAVFTPLNTPLQRGQNGPYPIPY